MNDDLKKFVEKVMRIAPGYAGMGGASAGIVGALATSNQIIQELRTKVLAFAREAAKAKPDRLKLTELSAQVAGALLSVKLVNGISDTTLNRLLTELDTLLNN